MRNHKPFLCMTILMLTWSLYAGEGEDNPPSHFEPIVTNQHFDIGAGFGLDYGGLVGVKFSYMPLPYFSVFGGAGYYLYTLGWNVGINGYILPATTRNVFRPYIQIMYGVNAGTVVIGKSSYNAVFYGFTPGIGTAIRFGDAKRHGFDVNLNIPVRNKKFEDQMDLIKADPAVQDVGEPLPVAFSMGYHISF